MHTPRLKKTSRAPLTAQLSRRGCLLGLSALAACGRDGEQPGTSRPLVLVVSSTHAPAQKSQLKALIEQGSGLKVELLVASSDTEALDLIQAGRADGGLLSLFGFLYCLEVFKVEPVAQLLRRGGSAEYEGEIVVKAGSPLADVKALQGKTVGFVAPDSVTGFLLPARLLREAGVKPEVRWLGSHERVLQAVRDGQIDAGASYGGQARDQASLRVLARTPRVPNEPVFVRDRVPASTRAALARALTGLSASPAALEGVADAAGFGPISPGAYKEALATVSAAGKQVEDLVPSGWRRASEHRRPLWSYAP